MSVCLHCNSTQHRRIYSKRINPASSNFKMHPICFLAWCSVFVCSISFGTRGNWLKKSNGNSNRVHKYDIHVWIYIYTRLIGLLTRLFHPSLSRCLCYLYPVLCAISFPFYVPSLSRSILDYVPSLSQSICRHFRNHLVLITVVNMHTQFICKFNEDIAFQRGEK